MLRVGVSWLDDWEFCPQKFYLWYQCEVIAGVVDTKSLEQLDGIRAHELLDTKAIPCAMSEDEAVVRDVLAGENLPEMRDFALSDERMIGRIDGLVLSEGIIRVIEDKRFKKSRVVFPSHKLQVKGYAALFKSVYPVGNVPIFVVIRDEDTLEELWSALFTMADNAEVWSAVSDIEAIIAGAKKATPKATLTEQRGKCSGCKYRYVCTERC